MEDRTDSLVSLGRLYKDLDASFAGVKVLLVDACRNDPGRSRGRSGISADNAPRPPRGVAALFSCSAGELAFEHDDLKHGVFFHYVLEGLKGAAKDEDNDVTWDSLSAYVRKQVAREVPKLIGKGSKQTPSLNAGELAGEPPVLVSGFVPLFNGKDFNGWRRPANSAELWKVENGVIVGEGSGPSYLFSERGDFENFHLRLEARINDPGNSGLFFRTRFSTGNVPLGYEAQIAGNGDRNYRTGSLFGIVKVGEHLVPPDTWFTQEVIAVGAKISIRINGKTTAEFDDPIATYRRGHLALQIANFRYTGATSRVEVRKVEIRELPRTWMPDENWIQLFTGRDLRGWKVHRDAPGTWQIEDGLLVCKSPAQSHLFTDQDDYKNLHFRVEAKFKGPANSGLFFRAKYGPPWIEGYEAQIDNTNRGDHKTGSLYNRVKIETDLVPPDTWFTMEVIARGNHIIINADGKTVVDYRDPERTYTRGHLALQQNWTRDGAELYFRKVEVRELPPGE